MTWKKPHWLYKCCPGCGTDTATTALLTWRVPWKICGPAACVCSKCGTRWDAWPLREALFGTVGQRVIVMKPGRLTSSEVAEWLRLRRQYARRGELDR